MADREAKSHDGKAARSIRPHQSAWMTHWTGSRSNSSPITHDHATQFSRNSGDDHAIKKPHIASDSIGSSEEVNVGMSLKKPTSHSFPFFKLGQESRRSSMLKNEGETALGPQVARKKLTTVTNVETSSTDCRFQPESVSQNPTEHVKYHMFFGESSHACSRPSKEKFTGSASRISMDQGGCKFDSPAKHEKSEMQPFVTQNNTALLGNDPSTNSNHSPAFIKEQYQRMERHIGMGFSPEMIKSSTSHHGQCSFQNVPQFIQDVETTRICTPLNSIGGLAGGLHRFSRTTHSFLVTKQTDVDLYQENQIFRESRVSTQQLHSTPPHIAHGQRGVKLQLLSSSSDRDLQENVEDVKTAGDVQKNESSADTDTMDMESFKERNHLSGANSSSPSNKEITPEPNLPPVPPTALATGKDRHGKRKIELPDMNLELPAQPAASSSTDKTEPCPSRTQSLDMNTLLFKVDQTSNSKSDDCTETNLGPEPGSRWIKRLKLSSSKSPAPGTKRTNLAEASTHGKLSQFFRRIVEGRPETALGKCHSEKSESLIGESHGKESTAPYQVTAIPKKGESTSVETRRACENVTLSHSWIQRWSRNQGHKSHENVENCKPGSSKLAVEEFQKKQFPSIGAMALMGKAMTGFQRCKFQRKESFVVWNTKGFESEQIGL